MRHRLGHSSRLCDLPIHGRLSYASSRASQTMVGSQQKQTHFARPSRAIVTRRLRTPMFLIEKLPAETTKDVQAFLDALVARVYGRRPEWLDYDLRESYRFRGREFVQIFCPAGSVHAQLSLLASTEGGISRDILQLGTRNQQAHAWLLHKGQEFEYDSNEIERVG
jgi:hypothetical protein